MNNYKRYKRIDEYISGLPEWQQAICQRVRDIVHGADTNVSESIKRTNRPYFVLDGNICASLDLFRVVIANNRASGWRKLQK